MNICDKKDKGIIFEKKKLRKNNPAGVYIIYSFLILTLEKKTKSRALTLQKRLFNRANQS
jgi:hypothetical protein